MNVLIPSTTDLALAAILLLAIAGLSTWLALGAARSLLVAAARMTLQLILVGLVLRHVFANENVWLTALIIILMLAAATREVIARQRHGWRGTWGWSIGGTVIGTATLSVTLIALHTALRPDPWYAPQHVIPLVGIILGSVMNSASLALNALLDAVKRERAAVEARLALGAARSQAFRSLVQRAVLSGVMPNINQMSAAGIITLPGIMTGQILAGMPPLDAARYQILLMFLLASGGLLAAMGVTRLAIWRLSDNRDRLRLDRMSD